MAANELKLMLVKTAAVVRDAVSPVTFLEPGRTRDPAGLTEWVELEDVALEAGAGRAAERVSGVTVTAWVTVKRTTNKARALEIANLVADALEDADIQVATGKWLRLHKPGVSSLRGELDLQQVEVRCAGIYVRAG